MAMNIDEQANLRDIALYIRYRLKLIANQRQLGDHWPGQMLSAEFVNQAEGLFLWASTICDYLLCVGDPTMQLEMLLSKQRLSGPPAEQKMDTVYANILGSCCWQDNDFVKAYGLIMGAILAAKTPLSSSALQAFHPSIPQPVSGIIDSLGPLLTVPADDERPVRIQHQLLREFLTVQAKLLPETELFYINEVEHSQRLVLLCLGVLNQCMMQNIPGTGYLCGHTHGIPKIAGDHITEELWYACRFWIDHLVEVNTPMKSLKDLLQVFFSENVVCWIEIMASRGQNCALHRVHKWIHVSMHSRDILQCSDIFILIRTTWQTPLCKAYLVLSLQLHFVIFQIDSHI
jgi:hypothetical protein